MESKNTDLHHTLERWKKEQAQSDTSSLSPPCRTCTANILSITPDALTWLTQHTEIYMCQLHYCHCLLTWCSGSPCNTTRHLYTIFTWLKWFIWKVVRLDIWFQNSDRNFMENKKTSPTVAINVRKKLFSSLTEVKLPLAGPYAHKPEFRGNFISFIIKCLR